MKLIKGLTGGYRFKS